MVMSRPGVGNRVPGKGSDPQRERREHCVLLQGPAHRRRRDRRGRPKRAAQGCETAASSMMRTPTTVTMGRAFGLFFVAKPREEINDDRSEGSEQKIFCL
jgi:hypothetical protein